VAKDESFFRGVMVVMMSNSIRMLFLTLSSKKYAYKLK